MEENALPPHLQAYPQLRELDGEVGCSVRAIYNGYFGCFDGHAITLHPLTAVELTDLIRAAELGCNIALEIKAEALFKLGESAYNASARAYYFNISLEPSGQLEPAGEFKADIALAHQIPLEIFLNYGGLSQP